MQLLLTFCLTSCAGPSVIELRTDLIRPYRYQDQEMEPFRAPYLSIYEKGRKKIVYVAAVHSSDPNSSTFKTIRYAFDKYPPQVTLIEGVEFDGTDSPKAFQRRAAACAEHAFQNCSESAFVAFLAKQNGIPFTPSEIPASEVAQRFADAGYPREEYELLTAGQLIVQYKRQQKEKLLRLDQDLRSQAGVSYGKFKKWFNLKSGLPFSLDGIDSETFSPQVDQSPTYFNRLAALNGMLRERFILERLKDALKRFDRILIVYGAGHLVKERSVLQEAFGPPIDLQP